MLKMTIQDWKSRIDRQFEAGLFDKVEIGKKRKTQELTNFEFCLIPEEILEEVSPPVEEELEERQFILSRSQDVFDQFLMNDINSRQGAFVNNYDGKDNHCISYFHHYVRNGKHSLNVYVRSMNYKDNFVFDCQTFNLAYKTVYDNLKSLYYDKVEQGFIRVFVFSLHIYV
jgi:hypothetical protein